MTTNTAAARNIQLADGASIVVRSVEDATKINMAPFVYYPAATAGWAAAPITATTLEDLARKLGCDCAVLALVSP